MWRRTTLEEYKKDDPKWEIVLNVDELAEKEDKVFNVQETFDCEEYEIITEQIITKLEFYGFQNKQIKRLKRNKLG